MYVLHLDIEFIEIKYPYLPQPSHPQFLQVQAAQVMPQLQSETDLTY